MQRIEENACEATSHRTPDEEPLLPLHDFRLQGTFLQGSPHVRHLWKRTRHFAPRQQFRPEKEQAVNVVTRSDRLPSVHGACRCSGPSSRRHAEHDERQSECHPLTSGHYGEVRRQRRGQRYQAHHSYPRHQSFVRRLLRRQRHDRHGRRQRRD